MIFGRPANLAMGAISAVMNVLFLSHVGGINPTPDLIAALNVAVAAIVAFFAYQAGQALNKANGTTPPTP